MYNIEKAWYTVSCGDSSGPDAVDDSGSASRAVRVTRCLAAGGLAQWACETASEPVDLSLKLESEQVTGSFKARGAVVAVGFLLDEAGRAGDAATQVQAVTASTGNHGKAVSRAVSLWRSGALGPSACRVDLLPARVHVPSNVAPHKLAALKAAGSEVVVASKPDCAVAESEARASTEGRSDDGVQRRYISPYNDLGVLAGQATLAVEWAAQQAARLDVDVFSEDSGPSWQRTVVPFDSVLVPVGGGGMVAGVGAYLKAVWGAGIEVVGCQPAANAAMLRCLQAGRALDDGCDGQEAGGGEGAAILGAHPPVAEWATVEAPEEHSSIRCKPQLSSPSGRADGKNLPRGRWPYSTWLNLETLSDGTAGGVEPGSLTVDLCEAVVDSWECVPEALVAEAQAQALAREKLVVEGAAAVAIAALRQRIEREPQYATITQGGKSRPRRVGIVICGGNVSGDGLVRAAERAASSK